MTTTIETQPAPVIEHTSENPDVIELTISEVDRQTASQFRDIHNCLICTALKNRGYNVTNVNPYRAKMEDESEWYFDEFMGYEALSANLDGPAPFYRPELVGKVIRLRKVR